MTEQLKYQRRGRGKTLVLVHGYLGGSGMWHDQIALFSEEFDVIAPDLPGFGESADLSAPDSIRGFAQRVLGLLDELGVSSFYLLGHSMGGMIVQEMALLAEKRIQKLICYGTGPVGVLPSRFETIDKSRERIHADGLDATAIRIAATWFIKGAEGPDFDVCLSEGSKTSLQGALAGLTAWESWNVKERLHEISCPTLVLWGDKDRSYGWEQPEAIWKKVPEASLAVVPGCAHNVHMEKPDIFNMLVMDFVKLN